MPGIFISYRRQDTLAEARAVYERLRGEFGHQNVFIDLEGLDYGVDFVEQLERQLENCQVLLALIGPHWLDLPDGRGGRRIDDENDFVRIELRTALARGVRVVPVLINGALMPRTVDLPADLHALLRRQALELDFKRFDGDMGRLVGSLRRVTSPATPPVAVAEPPPATPQPAPATGPAPLRAQSGRQTPPSPKAEPELERHPAELRPAQESATPVPAPTPRKPRPRAKPVGEVMDESAPVAQFASGSHQRESWWQSAASKIASGAVVVAFLGYQAWHNGWWKSDQPASSGVVVGKPSAAAAEPSAVIVASAVRLGTPVVVSNTEPASTATTAPPPARVASVALGRPISINAGVQQGLQSPPEARPAQEPVAAMAPLTRFRDCDSDVCPWMVVLPAGSFLMGSPANEPKRQPDEGPEHRVQVPAFAAGQYEINFEQWDACVAAGGCSHKPADEGWGRGKRPVINVSWKDAQGYARWLSTKTGRYYRLLSEAEWEYAARAGTTTPFAFGQQINTAQANFDGSAPYNGSTKGEWRRKTLPVGSLAANAWQLYDMHGNVWEWVADCWHDRYASAPADGSAWTTGCKEDRRVLRGGGWNYVPHYSRSAFRDGNSPGDRINSTGFRLARTLLVP